MPLTDFGKLPGPNTPARDDTPRSQSNEQGKSNALNDLVKNALNNPVIAKITEAFSQQARDANANSKINQEQLKTVQDKTHDAVKEFAAQFASSITSNPAEAKKIEQAVIEHAQQVQANLSQQEAKEIAALLTRVDQAEIRIDARIISQIFPQIESARVLDHLEKVAKNDPDSRSTLGNIDFASLKETFLGKVFEKPVTPELHEKINELKNTSERDASSLKPPATETAQRITEDSKPIQSQKTETRETQNDSRIIQRTEPEPQREKSESREPTKPTTQETHKADTTEHREPARTKDEPVAVKEVKEPSRTIVEQITKIESDGHREPTRVVVEHTTKSDTTEVKEVSRTIIQQIQEREPQQERAPREGPIPLPRLSEDIREPVSVQTKGEPERVSLKEDTQSSTIKISPEESKQQTSVSPETPLDLLSLKSVPIQDILFGVPRSDTVIELTTLHNELSKEHTSQDLSERLIQTHRLESLTQVIETANHTDILANLLKQPQAELTTVKLSQIEGAVTELVRMKIEEFRSLQILGSGLTAGDLQMLLREAITELAVRYSLTAEQKALLESIALSMPALASRDGSRERPRDKGEPAPELKPEIDPALLKKTVADNELAGLVLTAEMKDALMLALAEPTPEGLENALSEFSKRFLEKHIITKEEAIALLSGEPLDVEKPERIIEESELEVSEVHTITGSVISKKSGKGISGIIIYGGILGNALTDAGGHFRFTNVPDGMTFTLGPDGPDYVFAPDHFTGRAESSIHVVFEAVREPKN